MCSNFSNLFLTVQVVCPGISMYVCMYQYISRDFLTLHFMKIYNVFTKPLCYRMACILFSSVPYSCFDVFHPILDIRNTFIAEMTCFFRSLNFINFYTISLLLDSGGMLSLFPIDIWHLASINLKIIELVFGSRIQEEGFLFSGGLHFV